VALTITMNRIFVVSFRPGCPRLHPYDDGASPKSTSFGENSSHL
jgi:hypothetical protein